MTPGPIDPRPGWVRERTYELHQSGMSYDAARTQAEAEADEKLEPAHTTVADLQAQRDRLLAEASRVREERNEALILAAEAQREVRQLRRKIHPAVVPPEFVELMPPELAEAHRRIRSILDAYPATTWNLDQSEHVLAALVAIVEEKQAGADVVDLAARRACVPLVE